jgi:dihydroorotate dehydrogenase electron transfer subunit
MMVWNFNDEKPMSLSLIDPVKNEIGISIRNVGDSPVKFISLI